MTATTTSRPRTDWRHLPLTDAMRATIDRFQDLAAASVKATDAIQTLTAAYQRDVRASGSRHDALAPAWGPYMTQWELAFRPESARCDVRMEVMYLGGGEPDAPGRLRGRSARRYRASRRAYGREMRAWKRAGRPPARIRRLYHLRMEAQTWSGARIAQWEVLPEHAYRDELILRATVTRMQAEMCRYVAEDGYESLVVEATEAFGRPRDGFDRSVLTAEMLMTARERLLGASTYESPAFMLTRQTYERAQAATGKERPTLSDVAAVGMLR